MTDPTKEKPATILDQRAYDDLMQALQEIASRTHERAGAEIYRIFSEARKQVENTVKREMGVHRLGRWDRTKLLKRLISDLEKSHGQNFTTNHLERMKQEQAEFRTRGWPPKGGA